MRGITARAFVLAAICVAVLGVVFSVAAGAWRQGGLGVSLGLAVILLGLGRLARGGERSLGWVLVFVGSLTVAGHLIELVLVPT